MSACPRCEGDGKVPKLAGNGKHEICPCPRCDGTGHTPFPADAPVNVEPSEAMIDAALKEQDAANCRYTLMDIHKGPNARVRRLMMRDVLRAALDAPVKEGCPGCGLKNGDHWDNCSIYPTGPHSGKRADAPVKECPDETTGERLKDARLVESARDQWWRERVEALAKKWEANADYMDRETTFADIHADCKRRAATELRAILKETP